MPVKKIDNSIKAAKFRVKFKDIFNLKEFYKAMHEWLLEYNWEGVNTKGKPTGEMWETLYMHRQNPGGDQEQWWWWRMQKIPTNNSYYKYHLDIDSHPLYILPAEVMRDGKKFKVNKGEIEVNVAAWIEFDYKGEWSNHSILRLFNQIFPQRIFRKDLYDKHKLELYREIYTFQDYIKRWFKLSTFQPFEEITPFHPSWSYPKWKK